MLPFHKLKKFLIMGNPKHSKEDSNTMNPVYPIPSFNNHLTANIISSLFLLSPPRLPCSFEANTRYIILSINISVCI